MHLAVFACILLTLLSAAISSASEDAYVILPNQMRIHCASRIAETVSYEVAVEIGSLHGVYLFPASKAMAYQIMVTSDATQRRLFAADYKQALSCPKPIHAVSLPGENVCVVGRISPRIIDGAKEPYCIVVDNTLSGIPATVHISYAFTTAGRIVPPVSKRRFV
ncbi:hypothetical protein SYNPS1DRAFT_27964 [Syncephalis pseudoplumigaleata]|uniref:MD-2-related lipid-recognition domain-containing protein n=1 Tax=Syncephalis pseudoplumigaleata TaxID=1712513 RepID=A0A4P9Z3G4_9FUNG|nr:hypothetical protein SYNPS1DRAFT_27964 [Syncephalis pseudoplumigaleata]|eukprot:RKP26341.1 hypothetical protein SYNPS1DRAFT_27964 [Syncephalis pseudoplumigaleata]